MKWQYDSLRRLIGRRLETVTVKELREEIPSASSKSGLARTRLYFTLDDGQALECIATGIVLTNHYPRYLSVPDMREHFAKDYAPIVELAADRDQPDGIRVLNYRSQVHE